MVADLCGLAAGRDPRLQTWAQASSLTVIACFPRAIRWLFHAAGVSLWEERTQFLNMRVQSAQEILDGLSLGQNTSEPSELDRKSEIANHKSPWVPWFPVIDYDRCVNCKQCMNFCLFGTYGLSDEGRVQVVKPSGCKTNCPACARMCPRQAIIFPKYMDSPINGDSIVSDRQPAGQAQGSAPTGDLYDRIRNRSGGGKRFSTQPDDSAANRSCPTLDSLKRELNIPDEVLASLSPPRCGGSSRNPRPIRRRRATNPMSKPLRPAVVLVADRTLSAGYRILFEGMFATMQTTQLPELFMRRFMAPPVRADENGRAHTVPLGLRRVESALLKYTSLTPDDVVCTTPERLADLMGPWVKVVGFSSSDPLGKGMSNTTTANFCKGELYTQYWTRKTLEQLSAFQRKYGFRIVVGGAGAWQWLAHRDREPDVDIDLIYQGYFESAGPRSSRIC